MSHLDMSHLDMSHLDGIPACEPLPFIDVAAATRRIEDVLETRRLWAGDGQYCALFERQFAAKCLKRFGIVVTNGSHAIEAALASLQCSPGDEILIPALTFAAVAISVIQQGCVPIPVDVRPETLNISADCARVAITPRTRALIAVHLAGAPCDMYGLRRVCDEFRIALIEDAAQAHFATFDNRPVGSFGDLACFSFQAAKIMTAGEGGIVITNDRAFKDYIDTFINYGRPPHGNGYDFHFLSSNYRMNELSAAVLVEQIAAIDAENAVRRSRYERLKLLIEQHAPVQLQREEEKTTGCSHSLIPIILPTGVEGIRRDNIVERLRTQGWPVRRGYPLISQTQILTSAVSRGMLTEAQKMKIEKADVACECATDVVDRLIMFNHALLYKSSDDFQHLAEALASEARIETEFAGGQHECINSSY